MKYYCGIDPGYANGAICLLREDLQEIIFHDITDKLPTSVKWYMPLIDFFRLRAKELKYIMIEKVSTSPMQGVVSAGNFKAAAMILEVLSALTGVPYDLVLPVKWQENTKVSIQKETLLDTETPAEREKKRRKNKENLKKSVFAWAQATYPQAELRSFTKDSNRADALGIAHYGLVKYTK